MRLPPRLHTALAPIGVLLWGALGCVADRESVVLVSIRGLSWSHLSPSPEVDDSVSATPLGLDGGICVAMEPLQAAETRPTLATFETGLLPRATGVPANTYLTLESGGPGARLEAAPPRLAAPSLAERVAASGGRATSLGAMFPRPHRPGLSLLLQPGEGVARGEPPGFVEAIIARAGPPPATPDLRTLGGTQRSDSDTLAAVLVETRWAASAARAALEVQAPALLVVDLPLFDRIGHAFGPAAPLSRPFDSGSRRSPSPWHVGLEAAKEEIRTLRSESPGRALILTSGNGFVGSRAEVLLDNLIATVLAPGDRAVAAPRIVPSAVTAELYFPAGTAASRVARVAQALGAARDPLTGSALIERLASPVELERLGIRWRDAAPDLWLQMAPGYTAGVAQPGESGLVRAARFRGDHGFRPGARAEFGLLCLDRRTSQRVFRRRTVESLQEPTSPATLAAEILRIPLD